MNNNIGGEGRKAFDPASPEFAHARPKPISNVLAEIATKPRTLDDQYRELREFASTFPSPSFVTPRPDQYRGRPIAFDLETSGLGGDRTSIAVLDSLGQIERMDFSRLERRVTEMSTNFVVQASHAEEILRRMGETLQPFMDRMRETVGRAMLFGADDTPRFHTGGYVRDLPDEVAPILSREQVWPRGTVTGRLNSTGPNRQWISSTPRDPRRDRNLFWPSGDEHRTIRFLDTEATFNPEHWSQIMNFGSAPGGEALQHPITHTFRVKGSDHSDAEVALMADILRELGAEIAEGEAVTSKHIQAVGLTRKLFMEKFEFRRKMVALVPVRILKRVRRTVAGIAVVEAENRFGERILAVAPTEKQ